MKIKLYRLARDCNTVGRGLTLNVPSVSTLEQFAVSVACMALDGDSESLMVCDSLGNDFLIEKV